MAGEFYVDTKRAAQDTPNVFSSFVESYMGYRMPAQMTILRARINALAQTQAGLQAIDLELAKDAKVRADLLKSASDLAGKMLAGGAERDKTLGTVITAAAGVTSAELGAQATVGAANVRASADVETAKVNRDSQRMQLESAEKQLDVKGRQALDLSQAEGGKVNTAETRAIEDEFTGILQDVQNRGFEPAAFEKRVDDLAARIAQQVSNPQEQKALQQRLQDMMATSGGFTPDVRTRMSSLVRGVIGEMPVASIDYAIDPTQPGYEPKTRLAGTPKAAPVGERLGDIAKGYVESGTRDLATGGGGTAGDGGGSIVGEFQSTRDAAPDVQPVLQRILGELDREGDRKQALLDARDRIAADPFGGLGSWREPLGGLKERAAKPAPNEPKPLPPMVTYGGGRATDENGREVKPPKMPKPEPVEATRATRDTKPAKSTARNAFLDDLEGMSTGGKLFMQANQRAGTDIAPASEMTDKRKRGKKPRKRDATMFELEAS